MSTIPTAFPTGGALDLVAIVRTQIQASVMVNRAALEALRAKFGAATTEASVEGQTIAALEKAISMASALLPLLA